MNKNNEGLTIQEVARLTGTTTRTLRWYDELGLVVPERDYGSNYRRYYEEQLKDLQQVLFFRELEFPLDYIKKILGNPNFNRLKALEKQYELLKQKQNKLEELLQTLALTLQEERGEYTMKHEERFQGFDFSHNPYEDEARKAWGDDVVDQANEKLDALENKQKENLSEKMKSQFMQLAAIRHTDPTSASAQQLIREWFTLLNTMGTYTPEMFANLGRMYVDDQRFTKNIDQYGEGLAQFMKDAMIAFAEQNT
jgi:DNA-binding transcriptional MerR regulator